MSRFDDHKNDTDTGFRKIDIDEYSENRFQEEEIDGAVIGPSGPDEKLVLKLLSQYPFFTINNKSLFAIFLFLINYIVVNYP